MATSLTLNVSANAEFNNFKDTIVPGSLQIPLSAHGFVGVIQNIGTTAENIDYGDLTSSQVGFCYLRNHDQANFITYGASDGGTMKPIGKLKPGEFAIFRLKPSEQLMAQSNSAACDLEVRIYRD